MATRASIGYTCLNFGISSPPPPGVQGRDIEAGGAIRVHEMVGIRMEDAGRRLYWLLSRSETCQYGRMGNGTQYMIYAAGYDRIWCTRARYEIQYMLT